MTRSITTNHNFIISIKSIEFDFSGTDWQEDHETEQEWENYKQELTSKYQNFSIYFEGYELPEDKEEDETIAGNADLKGCEESYYYRKLKRWIDENTCWCLLDIDYSVKKQVVKTI